MLLLAAGSMPPEEEQWDTIVVTAQPRAGRVLPPVSEVGEEQLLERQPRSVAEVLKGLPGVTARTNSRGETVARVRGSEERQTQVFLDGAPLAVPWDSRVDLGIIPAGLIGSARVTKGAVPIEYGANAVAGAVDLETRSGGELDFRASASIGTLGFADASVVGTIPSGNIDLTLAASGLTRNSEPVAKLSAIPFSQARSDRRTNTDAKSGTLFAAARYASGPLTIRGYLLHLEAERGIAPESDRDPLVDAPRYWRYPDVDQTQLSLSTDLQLGSGSSLRLVGWRQWFEQRILQFGDVSYTNVRTREDDEDDTTGGRLVLSTPLRPFQLRIVGTAQTSRHAQLDTAFPANAAGPRLAYRQNLYTVGAEADAPLGPGRLSFGLAYDRSANPLTGDKPRQPATGALAFSAAFRAPLRDGLALAISGGRRNRFPSARELFGEALGRFLPNPELRPEQAWLADAELKLVRPGLTLSLNPFLTRSQDTISQRVVTVSGRRLRQRFNLSGSVSYGIDGALTAQLVPELDLELSGTLLRARADEGDAAFRRLPQRPSYEVMTAFSYQPGSSLSLRAEFRRVGPAVDLSPSGERAILNAGNEINLRTRFGVAKLKSGAQLFLTGSIDNLTDDVITPQLGLPAPGRSVRIGFQLG
jgi:iron complex outermembrane receptor protein